MPPAPSPHPLPPRIMRWAATLALAVIVLLAGAVWTTVLRTAASRNASTASGPAANASSPLADFSRAWRDDPVWLDGQAEIALYDATRTVHGQPRRYIARVMTNKEHADPRTTTRSPDAAGRAVFKHHLRDDIPTERDTWHFSTMVYVGVDDLKSLKLEMGSQEDGGATCKQYVNHAGTLTWRQSSYFPHEGPRTGSYAPPGDFAFQDALSLLLRAYPFDDPPAQLRLTLLDDQTTNRLSRHEPSEAIVHYVGRQTLDLPLGAIDAHHLRVLHLRPPVPEDSRVQNQVHDYYFAAEGAAPRLHVLVAYDGPDGMSYRLREQKRDAYWRP